MKKNNLKISVVIPFYTHENLLTKCISALKRQTLRPFEVIVVYNGEGCNSKELVEKSGFKWIRESKIGSYSARNAGIKAAKGNIIAFTDSDCIPKEDWIERAIEAFENNKNIDIIGGRMDLIYKKDNDPKVYEIFENTFDFNQKYFIEENHSGCTSNLFIKKEVFKKIGLFDESFKSMGDYSFTTKAYKNGLILSYIDDVLVYHPTRDSFWKFILKQQRLAGGAYVLIKKRSRNIFDLISKIFITNIMDSLRCFKIALRERLKCGIKIKLLVMIAIIHQVAILEQVKIFFGRSVKNE
jgi:GT2 family glycosyltransferase